MLNVINHTMSIVDPVEQDTNRHHNDIVRARLVQQSYTFEMWMRDNPELFAEVIAEMSSEDLRECLGYIVNTTLESNEGLGSKIMRLMLARYNLDEQVEEDLMTDHEELESRDE